MYDFTVGPDRRDGRLAGGGLEDRRRGLGQRTIGQDQVVGLGRVRDSEGYVLDAISVLIDVAGDLRPWVQARGDDEPRILLIQHVGNLIAETGLGPLVSADAEPVKRPEVLRGLVSVANPELDVGESSDGARPFVVDTGCR